MSKNDAKPVTPGGWPGLDRDDLSDFLKGHAVTISRSCEPGHHVYLSSDDGCVCIGSFPDAELGQAEAFAALVRDVVGEMHMEFYAYLVDQGAVVEEGDDADR